MSSVIPAIGLLVVVLLSADGKPKASPNRLYVSRPGSTQPFQPNQSANSLQNMKSYAETPVINKSQYYPEHADEDYRSILTYIQKKYHSVSKEDAEKIADSLVRYGKQEGVDPKFAAAVMARESAFNKIAVSPTGAKGLGQIKSFNYPSLDIQDPFDIEQNVRGTVSYIKEMLSVWDNQSEQVSLALASYYQGQGTVRKNNKKVDKTTQSYVDDIMKHYQKLKDLYEKKDQGSRKT